MQFQVPQFIDSEDKIIGPLTIRQFAYIAGGAGLSFIFYFLVEPIVWAFIAVILLGAAAGLAFVNINGQQLPKVLAAAFRYYWNPQTFVWQPETPNLPKTPENVGSGGFSLEKIVAGIALKNTWRYLQTGSKAPEEPHPAEEQVKTKETYQVFRPITGERKVAKRVDYR